MRKRRRNRSGLLTPEDIEPVHLTGPANSVALIYNVRPAILNGDVRLRLRGLPEPLPQPERLN